MTQLYPFIAIYSMNKTSYNCFLCHNRLSSNPIIEEERQFCCHGCHAVHRILSAKNELSNYQEHPVFKQAVRSGLISNSELLEEIRQKQASFSSDEIQKLHLEIGDLWCPSCAEVIKLVLMQEKGVRKALCDYATDLCVIEYAPRLLSKEKIVEVIKSLGYHPITNEDPTESRDSSLLHLRFIVAAFFSLNIMMFAYPIYASYFDFDPWGYSELFSYLSLAASLPVLFYSGSPIFRRAWSSFWAGYYGMEILVAMGVSAAFFFSIYELYQGSNRVYFDSMTVIITFVLLGKMIEMRAKFSAKESLGRLNRSLPRRARKRLADGREGFVALKEVGVGDQIVVLTGERIPLDGVVIEGEGCCDESLMTGEAIPVDKKVGSLVMGGSFLQQGMICYEVVSEPDQSLLHQILQTIQQNIGQKAIYTRAADRIAHWFVPFVLLIAIGAAFFTFFFVIEDSGKGVVETAIMRAISILLISCPCAIGIAAPLAESQLLNGLASMGAIVRNRGSLQYLGREDFIVFDKTGTLTEGKFIVRHGLEELTEDQLSALKGLASKSTHPISSAIASRIEYPPLQFSKIEEFPGLGLRGFQGSDSYLLGSADFIGEGGIEENSFTTVYFVCNGVTLAKLYLSDTIKAGISQLLAALRPAEALLLSGDCKNAVEHAAKQCGFTQWKWGCHPSQKREAVADLKKEGHIVAMVGDGINDAPALTQADIGISVVNATDISIQVSDIILTTDNFAVIPKMRDLAILARRIMKQNLFWAFFYNGLGIGLAIFGLLTPIFAAFAMVASSIMVLLNAQRIKVK